MKPAASVYIAAMAILALAVPAWAVPVPVEKPADSPKIYMHYMPWFQTPSSLGGTGGSSWGLHWKMDTQNPNIVDASGKRQIAAHYYPKIGPYDSTDSDVIEYHSLLMKYSGVDGALVDWYGEQGSNGDVGSLLTASNAFVNKTSNFGLGFGVVAEDNFWTTNGNPDIGKAEHNVGYLRDHYFNQSNYIRAGASSNPLMMVFGPNKFQTASQWTQIFGDTGTNPEFLPLEYQMGEAGANADGEFAWPYQSPGTTDHLTQVRNFYTSRAPGLTTAAGVAYPGFNDFYAQGQVGGHTLFYIPENNGQTLASMLSLYNTYKLKSDTTVNLDMLQLATFNDFGEGTMFEPTVETGFNYLHQLQTFTGAKDPVTHRALDESDLQMIYELYLARKKYSGNVARQALLGQVSDLLSAMQIDSARTLFEQASPDGDYNADGLVNMSDYNFWRSAYGKSTIIYGSGADGDFNGSIDIGDYLVWRKSFAASGAGTSLAAIPEPPSRPLLVFAAVLLCCCAVQRGDRVN
jgi:glycosyl hydrolase family 99